MSYEGAMLGGVLLPEEEFIELMTQKLIESSDNILAYLKQVVLDIDSGNIKQAYEDWESFFTQVLKNPTTSLLAILHFHPSSTGASSTEEQKWVFVADEANAIKNQSGKINIQAIGPDLKREYLSQVLTQHLSNLFTEISGQMERDEIRYLYELKKNEIYEQLNPIKYGSKNYTYQTAVYGARKGRFYNGQVADAYLNHIGATHFEYLQNFSETGVMKDADHLLNSSVKQEERAINKLNFIRLLTNSTNSTAWYTGGDLIVTNKNGQVVANIQLKTSGGSGAWIGNIRTATLKKKIQEIILLMEAHSEEVAVKFFNLLKTSSVSEALGDAAIKTGYDIAYEALGLTK